MRGCPMVSFSFSMTCAGAGRSGIAHAEVDDVGAGVARGRLGAVDLLEHVGRQAADAVEVFHGPGSSAASRFRYGPPISVCITGCGQLPAARRRAGRLRGGRRLARVFFSSSRRRLLSASLSALSCRGGGMSWTDGIGRRRRRPLRGPLGRPPHRRAGYCRRPTSSRKAPRPAAMPPQPARPASMARRCHQTCRRRHDGVTSAPQNTARPASPQLCEIANYFCDSTGRPYMQLI